MKKMKFKALRSIAVLAVVGAAFAATSVAHAAVPSSKGSTGTLEVEAGNLDTGTVVDPENPTGPKLPTDENGPIFPNKDIGNKGIIGVTNLDFGQISIGTTTANAASVTVDSKVRGNMVSFGDMSGDYTGYTITGELTKQFTNGTTTLNGATISFTNGIVESDGVGTITGKTMTQTLDNGDEGTGAKTFISAAKTEGSGQWTMEFGQDSASNASSSVVLTIPKKVAETMTVGSKTAAPANPYTATITWTMSALPTE